MASHQPMRPTARIAASFLVALLASAVLCPTAGAEPTAHAARTINVSQTAQLRLIRRSGATLYEQGTASGTLPGVVAARLVVNVTKVGGEITFYPRGGGTITFHAHGVPQAAGTLARASGTMTIVKATGRYAGASGRFRFNAIVNRRSWAISVSASGRMTY